VVAHAQEQALAVGRNFQVLRVPVELGLVAVVVATIIGRLQ
jgi:hypothetical protein